jgi:hypothetical protein
MSRDASGPPEPYDVLKEGQSWVVRPAGSGWVFDRTFPTKWQATLALQVWLQGGRVSDYWAAARKRKTRSAAPAPPVSPEQRPGDVVQAVYAHAAGLLKDGFTKEAVQAKLLQTGLDTDSAAAVVNNLLSARAAARHTAGREMMLTGFLVCLAGIAFTLISHSSAKPGGYYTVWTGAIFVGAIQFLRGVWHSLS